MTGISRERTNALQLVALDVITHELHGHHRFRFRVGLCHRSIIIAVGIGTCRHVVLAVHKVCHLGKGCTVGKRETSERVLKIILRVVESHNAVGILLLPVDLHYLYGFRLSMSRAVTNRTARVLLRHKRKGAQQHGESEARHFAKC